MTRRFALLGFFAVIAVIAVVACTPVTASASPATDPAAVTSTNLPADPLLGGVLDSSVRLAEQCGDWGQCVGYPNGTTCDTPVGCVCYNPPGPGGSRCGRP